MRKGEKLLEYFAEEETKFFKVYPRENNERFRYKRLQFIHNILENISDEQLDEIFKS